MIVLGLWEEAIVPRESPCSHGETPLSLWSFLNGFERGTFYCDSINHCTLVKLQSDDLNMRIISMCKIQHLVPLPREGVF